MEKSELFDHNLFQQRLEQVNHPLQAFRGQLKEAQVKLRQGYKQGMDAVELISLRSWLVDQLLMHAWVLYDLADEQHLALIATGGYGREELLPYSDVDVMILISSSGLVNHQNNLERFITFLWDIGLNVAQSVRTIDECVDLATQDVTVCTHLLDARLIIGSENLYEQLNNQVDPSQLWSKEDFYQAKMAEQQKRHEKYGNTSYNLEPNIKEGPGGFRDIHTILWVAKQCLGIDTLHDLVTQGFLTKADYQILERGQNYLWLIRTALHHVSTHKENRLLFDHQVALAKQFSYEDNDAELAVEQFMKQYYCQVKELNELNDMLLQLFDENIISSHHKQSAEVINDRFQIRNGYIETRDDKVFVSHPSALLEIFLLIAKDEKIRGVRAETIRLLREYRHTIDDAYRHKQEHRDIFIALFRQNCDVGYILRLMNRYGILGEYLPAFGKLIGKMQYDLYHVYTVDRHLIAIVRNAYAFTQTGQQQKFPLCYAIMEELEQKDILYLATLFHDIGKGRGGDHSILGAEDAAIFCEQHGLNTEDSDLIVWLVENHLIMSSTAQRMDIYDPDVIAQFASQVKTKRYLDYLYLLTCADICATNESLWNSWRDSLLRDLYRATKNYLVDEQAKKLEKAVLIANVKNDAINHIDEQCQQQAKELWQQWGNAYFLHHSAKRIAWHTKSILERQDIHEPLILISPYRNEGGTEIFIYTEDREYLFAKTTASLDKLQLNIVEAQIITTQCGYTLDSYIVIDKHNQAITAEKQMEHISVLLRKNILAENKKPSLAKRQKTMLEVNTPDRTGLLARIGLAFYDNQVNLSSAKIVTLGDRVEDIFYITDRGDQPIEDEGMQQRLADSIKGYLDQGG